MAKSKSGDDFESFLKQQRVDAAEDERRRQYDRRDPRQRAIDFLQSLEDLVSGRETEIRTMKGDLRVFDWRRRSERIWFRASDYEMAVEADDDGKVHVTGKKHPRPEGGRAASELVDAPELSQVIDVAQVSRGAADAMATKLLAGFLKTAYQ